MAPPAAGGNFLTRKLGPLPTWAWAGLGVVGYLYWRKRQAASSAGTPAVTGGLIPSPGAAIGSSGGFQAPSGYGYQGPGVGLGGSGQVPMGAIAQTTATTVNGVGPGGATGNFYPTTEGYAGLLASNLGNQIYYNAPGNPGLYLPVTQQVAATGAATGQQLAIGPTFQ